MPIEFGPDLFENDDFRVETDANGDLVQTHKQTGAEFKFDATKDRWIPVQGLDLEGATIDNAGSIAVDSLSATQLAQALNANGNDITNIGAADADSVNTGDLTYSAGVTFKEDDNSPLEILGESSGTITLADEYDAVKMIMTGTDSGPTELLDMQINGDTGSNYEYVDNGDNTTSGATSWEGVAISNRSVGQHITLSGSWGNAVTFGTSVHGQSGGRTIGGRNNSVPSPLNSITIKSSSSFDAKFSVIGIVR